MTDDFEEMTNLEDWNKILETKIEEWKDFELISRKEFLKLRDNKEFKEGPYVSYEDFDDSNRTFYGILKTGRGVRST